jgi:hypothetical protein
VPVHGTGTDNELSNWSSLRLKIETIGYFSALLKVLVFTGIKLQPVVDKFQINNAHH